MKRNEPLNTLIVFVAVAVCAYALFAPGWIFDTFTAWLVWR